MGQLALGLIVFFLAKFGLMIWNGTVVVGLVAAIELRSPAKLQPTQKNLLLSNKNTMKSLKKNIMNFFPPWTDSPFSKVNGEITKVKSEIKYNNLYRSVLSLLLQ